MEAPMSSSLGAMGPLLRKLDLLLAPEYPLRRSLKQAIELLKEDLEEVNDDLVEQSMLESPSNKAKYWMNEARELSYDIEDCIDDMMRPHTGASAKVRSVHGHRVARLKINRLPKLRKASTRMARIAEVRALLRETSERHERYQLDDCSSKSRFAFTGTHSRVSALCKTSVDLIGVDDSRKKLTDWLTNQEENQLKVLAIVGSPGIGKTTLVRALYRELKGQFECRAFIRVSRKPDMSKLTGEILSQVQGPKQTSDYSALQNSIDSIRVLLQDKRYFIVIDDLWDSTAWDILNNAFPKSQNCSRIIITAEVQDVVAECGGYHSVNVLQMEPLGSHDSEKLFLHRGFGSEHHCPDQLKEVSCRIVKECRGLPLAIITMAGLLASELDNTDIWNQLLQCFFPSLAILTLEEMLEKIVNHCYNSLPQYLKTCLLYLNIYPEGSAIWKVDLLKQWIAEGFVSPTEGKEGVAESYFDELVNRGMIHPEKISHNDEVLSCTVHHSVRDLIRHKSSEEKFITEIDYSQTIPGFHMKAHRLSLHFSCAMYASKPEGIRLSQVRSLAFFGFHRCMPSTFEFKHLRVLNLELWGDYDDCTTLNLSGLCRLFQLRYLKVVSHIFVELPSQIQGLQFLETLEIDAKVSATPIDLAYLPSLLHLSLRDGTKLHDGIGRITSLQTLQHFDIGSNSEDNVWSLGELINLQDLRLTCSQASSDEHLKRNLVALSSSLGRLANLRSLILAPGIVGLTMFVDDSYVMSSIPIFLQRLELSSPICTFSRFPEWIAKLQKLRTLKIIVRVLLQNDIDILAGLPVLTSVSLFVCRPTSYGVVFHSGAFPVLKNFKYRCGALWLIFKDKASPNLQRLKLGFNVHRGGQYADMISGIEYLYNLKEINIEIGAAACAEESDRRAAEFALQKAIKKHPRFHYFLNIKRVHWIEEEIPVYKLEDGYNPLAAAAAAAVKMEEQAAMMPAPSVGSMTPQSPSLYQTQKRRDWNAFGQYLRNHLPPLSLAQCSGAHVLEFLRYLDQFGKTKVHTPACSFFGHPNPPAPCPCPLRQAWGSLDSLVGRLRAAFEENGGRPESNPFAVRTVRLYLREIRENQARARGIEIRENQARARGISYVKKKRKKPQQLQGDGSGLQDHHPQGKKFRTAGLVQPCPDGRHPSSRMNLSPPCSSCSSPAGSAPGSPIRAIRAPSEHTRGSFSHAHFASPEDLAEDLAAASALAARATASEPWRR